ncbi:(2Fe-2S)-binding protein [Mameliella alba]|uniref:(2Fe-2S)-binding protein n=1 Tax=Mameliella alba TaxID=561184 RepID=UPI000B536AB8|nr:(2Fe-2S)-binding protein [Mameliella alba]OWV45865.1 sarcosine oxidase subunit alpha [Mameliella alba]OWV64440.1 sarcosine oxidase subunit alpha [Mameliella alba]
MVKAIRMETPRGPEVRFTFDGAPITGHTGETLAAALLAAGIPAFGITRQGQPRLPFCNMGTCFDCGVRVDGHPLVRACLTDVREGTDVRTQEGT